MLYVEVTELDLGVLLLSMIHTPSLLSIAPYPERTQVALSGRTSWRHFAARSESRF
jgi:hypothetical protein